MIGSLSQNGQSRSSQWRRVLRQPVPPKPYMGDIGDVPADELLGLLIRLTDAERYANHRAKREDRQDVRDAYRVRGIFLAEQQKEIWQECRRRMELDGVITTPTPGGPEETGHE